MKLSSRYPPPTLRRGRFPFGPLYLSIDLASVASRVVWTCAGRDERSPPPELLQIFISADRSLLGASFSLCYRIIRALVCECGLEVSEVCIQKISIPFALWVRLVA
jgi:hypothetical protein